jgi:hypothetical protein
MKIVKSIAMTLAVCLLITQSHAQTDAPKGYKKGNIVLFDSTVLSGYVKDNMSSNASLWFVATSGDKKKEYSGADILSSDIEGIPYICINGDFFKVICKGELTFLQKASDASGKVSYNGANAVFSSGTDGRPGDYFIYAGANKALKLVSKKNMDEVVTASFNGYTAAIEKAKTVNGDIAQLKEAVTLYNNRNK